VRDRWGHTVLYSHPSKDYVVLSHVIISKAKAKSVPWRLMGESRYSCYSFSTLELDGGEWSASRPGRALTPRKCPQVPIIQEAGWSSEPVWTEARGKIFCLCRGSNLDCPVVLLRVLLVYLTFRERILLRHAIMVTHHSISGDCSDQSRILDINVHCEKYN
jgi:hypothetical protein